MAAVTGSLTATGQSASFQPIIRERAWGGFNLEIRGTFVGTVVLQRSFDSGSNWVSLTALGAAIAWTAPCSEYFEENEAGTIYRVNVTAYTSGTVTYRLSQ